MLVTFKTSAYSDITMFGAAAVSLLKLMGLSGNVPGAMMADEVPEALRALKEGLKQMAGAELAHQPPEESNAGYDKQEPEQSIGLEKRAAPLVSLLEAAVKSKENILWES